MRTPCCIASHLSHSCVDHLYPLASLVNASRTIRAFGPRPDTVGDLSTFITRLDADGNGVRLAVKDVIDVEGVPTTAGCRAVADAAQPSVADAPLLAGARAAGARIVGKTNLHELGFGTTGINLSFGTPVNPIDANRVPGGSSSGSAVAVGDGDADIAFGSDTGGSIRIPSACCGISGLKTTQGRISLVGVWPLAPSLDTIGPMAKDIAGLVAGMQLLEPGFAPVPRFSPMVGRLRPADTDPTLEDAITAVLDESEADVVDIDLPGWIAAEQATGVLILSQAWEADGHLLRRRDAVGHDVAARLEAGRSITDQQRVDARETAVQWKAQLAAVLSRVQFVVLPTMKTFPPFVAEHPERSNLSALTQPVNLAGLPALALPIASTGPVPTSMQVIGSGHSEELLLAAGLHFEAAARSLD